ncbi:hypothetical protein V327_02608, partial [Staphylococcus aureus F29450_091412]
NNLKLTVLNFSQIIIVIILVIIIFDAVQNNISHQIK